MYQCPDIISFQIPLKFIAIGMSDHEEMPRRFQALHDLRQNNPNITESVHVHKGDFRSSLIPFVQLGKLDPQKSSLQLV
ncbi:MAG: hypothetical protein A2V45_05415 [Candidatus Aminicenantes bacterium RBG_19FT_COMBO_58_17]|nr:MAG: hypothetical protein A2V45_05415 [Candidatus Aminicenantes bacterium RBG_19FT_COMBO_58_17]